MSAAPALLAARQAPLRGEYRVPAAAKVLDILEFIADQSQGLTQTEISAGLDRSLHEIYRVLVLLEKRGYLVRDRADRLRLSLKLFELAHMHPPINRLVEASLPVMRELAAEADQCCHLVVLRDLAALVVLQVDLPLPMRYSVALGSRFPLLETSSGAVLLAALPPAERSRTLDRILAAGEGVGSANEIRARLAEAEARGYEMRPSLALEGCTNISFAVRDHTGAAVAALTVPFLPQKAARVAADGVFALVADAVTQISAALGAGSAAPVG